MPNQSQQLPYQPPRFKVGDRVRIREDADPEMISCWSLSRTDEWQPPSEMVVRSVHADEGTTTVYTMEDFGLYVPDSILELVCKNAELRRRLEARREEVVSSNASLNNSNSNSN